MWLSLDILLLFRSEAVYQAIKADSVAVAGMVRPQLQLGEEVLYPHAHTGVHLQAK